MMNVETGHSETVDILAVTGAGDEGEPVVIIMLSEDEGSLRTSQERPSSNAWIFFVWSQDVVFEIGSWYAKK